MSLPSWLKRTFAALMLVIGLGIAMPGSALAAGTSTTPGCGQTNSGTASASSIENSDLLPVVRWSDATGSIHSRLDGKWYGDITQKLQRNVEDSGFMSLGNTEFSTATQILEMSGDFCPGQDSAVKIDQEAGNIGGELLDLHGAYAWGWVGLLLSGVIIKELWTARRTGSVNWNPIMRFGGLTVALALMVTQASSSNGKSLATFSPGWIINQMESTTAKLATSVASIGNPAQPGEIKKSIASPQQVRMADDNQLSCINYETMMIEEFQAKYQAKGSLDGRGVVPLLMNRMWMNTGLRAYTETQYGADNFYGPQVACRGLEWNSGKSADEQYAVEDGDAAGAGKSESLDTAVSKSDGSDASTSGISEGLDKGKIVKWGTTPAKPKKGTDKSYWYGYESDSNQRWDTDMIWVAACGYDGSKWFVQPGWSQAKDKDNPTDGVYNHDNTSASGKQEHGAIADKDPDGSKNYSCADAYNGSVGGDGKDSFGNWQDGQGTLSNGTPPNGSVTNVAPYNANDVKDAGGANPRDFISNLHGYTGAGSSVAALLYPVTGGIILVVFGGLGLVIFGLRFALLIAILAMIFVFVWALIRNSMDPVVRFFKMLLGAMFIAFMYLLILSIIDILTTMFLDLSGTFSSTSTGVASVIWTALAPLFSIALFKWFWDKFIKAPNPLSLKGGMSYSRAAAEGVMGATAAGLISRGAKSGASRMMNSATSRFSRNNDSALNKTMTSPNSEAGPGPERIGAMAPAGDDYGLPDGERTDGMSADGLVGAGGESAPGLAGGRGVDDMPGVDGVPDLNGEGVPAMLRGDNGYTMALPEGADMGAPLEIPGGEMDANGKLRAPTADELAIAAAAGEGVQALSGGGYGRRLPGADGTPGDMSFLTNGEYAAARQQAGLSAPSGRSGDMAGLESASGMTGAEAGIMGAGTALGSMNAGTARHLMDTRQRGTQASVAERARRGAQIHGDLNQLASQAAVSKIRASSKLADRIGGEESNRLGFGDGKAFGSERLGGAISSYMTRVHGVSRDSMENLANSRLGRSDMANRMAERSLARADARSARKEKLNERLSKYQNADGTNKAGFSAAVGRQAIRAGARANTVGRAMRTSAKTAPKVVGGGLAVGALAGGLAPVAMVAGGAAGVAYAAKAARAASTGMRANAPAKQAQQARNVALADKADQHQRRMAEQANKRQAKASSQPASEAPRLHQGTTNTNQQGGSSTKTNRREAGKQYVSSAKSGRDLTGKDRP